MSEAVAQQIDLTNCDREPIHLLGRVQRFGCLVGLTSDWIVSHASENVSEILGLRPEELIGARASTFLPAESIHTIRNRIQNMRSGALPEIMQGLSVGVAQRTPFDVTVHISGSVIVLEFEVAGEGGAGSRYVSDVQQAINRIGRLKDVGTILNFVVRFVGALTGFDRVMAYRFAPDASGEVVAEFRAPGQESFLGLHYPASDIPSQARTLYVKNPIRLISDVMDDGALILPAERSIAATLDLSHAVLRSVSSIHLEYLRNMGVGASMSISIIVEGRLWGLVACHHRAPKVLVQAQRNAVLLFAQMLSLLIEGRLTREDTVVQEHASEFINAISRSAAASSTVGEVFSAHADHALEIMHATGMAVVTDATIVTVGAVPRDASIRALARRLNTRPAGRIFTTAELRTFLAEAEDYKEIAAGMLSIPISKTPRDYIMFFRREVRRTVTWAGDPQKPATLGPNGIRLTPRKSFEAWEAEVDGQSEDWSRALVKAAEQLRITVLEVVLRMADDAAAERKKIAEKQELLIAELNHRVRNILGLVRSLISQTSTADLSTSEFAKVLDSRVQALARAHDQITRDNWSPAPIRHLILTEAAGYLLDKADRVVVEGEDILLTPTAYSSVALVVHELMTNSAKYGALADQRGKVTVTLSRDADGALGIEWLERDGPPVEAPKRRGFGSMIIERSIPYELQGEAEIQFKLKGVEARFRIPELHVREGRIMQTARPQAASENGAGGAMPDHVLLVEDNLIIAIDAEDIIRDLGARKVTVCGDVRSAMLALDDEKIDFALLDINLGSDLSIPVAERLMQSGIPFVFASGYGDNSVMPETMRGVPVLSKPYDADGLRKALSSWVDKP